MASSPHRRLQEAVFEDRCRPGQHRHAAREPHPRDLQRSWSGPSAWKNRAYVQKFAGGAWGRRDPRFHPVLRWGAWGTGATRGLRGRLSLTTSAAIRAGEWVGSRCGTDRVSGADSQSPTSPGGILCRHSPMSRIRGERSKGAGPSWLLTAFHEAPARGKKITTVCRGAVADGSVPSERTHIAGAPQLPRGAARGGNPRHIFSQNAHAA